MSDNKKVVGKYMTPNIEVMRRISEKFDGLLEQTVVKPETEASQKLQQMEKTSSQKVKASFNNKLETFFALSGKFEGKYAASKYLGKSISDIMTEERRVNNLIEEIEERLNSLTEEFLAPYRKAGNKTFGWNEERVESYVEDMKQRNLIRSGATDPKEIEARKKYMELKEELAQAKAEKKAGRIAAEGIVKTVVKDDKVAAIVEVNSETDFVAKNDEFQGFVEAVANQVVDSEAADLDAFMAEAWEADTTKTVKDALVEKIAVIGENLNIRRFEKVAADNGVVVPYIHGGGRIGVLVEADTDVVNDEIKAALKNVAMQVAAMSPKYVSREEVSQDYLDHEKEILLAQAKKENPEKPENIIEKMIIGRLNKELKEICLLDQVYVQDSDLTVGKYVDKVAKENGANVKVTKFVRFETGEGIEKKVDDFAAEVAAQAGM